MTDPPETSFTPPPPAGATKGGVRWWPLAVAVGLLAVVVWAVVTELDGIMGSNPAYLITLLVVTGVAIAMIVFALFSRPARITGSGGWVARAALVIVGLGVAGMLIYLRPMSAAAVAIDAVDDGNGVSVEFSASTIRMTPDTGARATGLVYYPGALVDPRSYAHVLRPIAEAGFPVVITMPPFNLAVIDSDAADTVVGEPDDGVTRWVVGGHSLGGAMASQYAESEREELVGLLLHAAYPVNDMSDRTGLAVASIFGTDDGITTPQEVDESRAELPATTQFVPIQGAIHAFFGDYGAQRGDGTPSVPRADAQAGITAATLAFMESVDRS